MTTTATSTAPGAVQGPSSVAIDGEGSLYFTDSGPLGETSLHAPHGSCYVISGPAKGQILRPLARNCLAHPCGIALSPEGDIVYVSPGRVGAHVYPRHPLFARYRAHARALARGHPRKHPLCLFTCVVSPSSQGDWGGWVWLVRSGQAG